MRVDPARKDIKKIDPEKQARLEMLTHRAALCVAFVSTFIFFIKLLFL